MCQVALMTHTSFVGWGVKRLVSCLTDVADDVTLLTRTTTPLLQADGCVDRTTDPYLDLIWTGGLVSVNPSKLHGTAPDSPVVRHVLSLRLLHPTDQMSLSYDLLTLVSSHVEIRRRIHLSLTFFTENEPRHELEVYKSFS